jgi:hypothetical protein
MTCAGGREPPKYSDRGEVMPFTYVAMMPDQDGHHMYRIKSLFEEYERVVKEDLLAKSDGYLGEEAPARVSRRNSITLPTLQAA